MKTQSKKIVNKVCGVCKEREIHLLCDGCRIPVCEECLRYGMYGTG